MQGSEKVKMEDTLKSQDTEEPIDILFYRPLGFRCAVLASKLHITPNMITIFSIFIGVAAGLLFYPADLKTNVIGMLLLVIASSQGLLIITHAWDEFSTAWQETCGSSAFIWFVFSDF